MLNPDRSRLTKGPSRVAGLTVWTATINGESNLARVLPGLRDVAEELVVGIDDSSTDASEEVAREYADTVIKIPHEHYLGLDGNPNHVSAVEAALPYFTKDWIFRVDHDETLGPSLRNKEHLQALLADRHTTHYWIPRRWAVPPGNRFIYSYPWHVDTQVRLYRNIPSIIRFSKQVHRHTTVLGQGRILTHDWLVHWDLVWHTRSQREQKVKFCESLSSYSGADYYLYEGQDYETRPLEYVPPSAVPLPDPPNTDDSLACKLELLEFPATMASGKIYSVLLGIQNRSTRIFFPASIGNFDGNVLLSYHWYREVSGQVEVYTWDCPRSMMPSRLAPGECLSTYLAIQAPPEPGKYWLQPDLVEESVAWASSSSLVQKYAVDIR